MSLKEQIPAILKHIEANENFTAVNKEIFDILEGDLYDKVVVALRKQLISDKAYESARRRVAPINIAKRIVDKLSKIYSTPVIREADNPTDQEIMDFYVKEMKLDVVFGDSNRFFNGTRATSIDPFLEDNKPRARVVPTHQFLPYSSNLLKPNVMDVYIKFMGERDNKQIYFLYSNEEFLAINSEGNPLPEFMAGNEGENPFKVIPQTYINRSNHLLVPKADKGMLQMAILIPLILTDLNFAVEYMSHSIIWGANLDVSNLELNPNAFWDLGETEDGKKPEVGQITPTVDIDQVLNLVKQEVDMWLESKNIKAGTGSAKVAEAGVALMIREADTTDDRKEQIIHYTAAEKDFWQRMKVIHNYWAETQQVSETRKFSDDFEPVIIFASPRPIESQMDVIKRHKELQNMDLNTKKMALTEIFPERKEGDIETILEEIKKEKPLGGLFGGETPKIQG